MINQWLQKLYTVFNTLSRMYTPVATKLCIFWRMRQQTRYNNFKMQTTHLCQPVTNVLHTQNTKK